MSFASVCFFGITAENTQHLRYPSSQNTLREPGSHRDIDWRPSPRSGQLEVPDSMTQTVRGSLGFLLVPLGLPAAVEFPRRPSPPADLSQ